MSPGKAARLAAQTARREAEDRTRREQERVRKERARKLALRAGKQRAEEEAREKDRRRQLREAQWEQQQFVERRDRVAVEQAARANVPSLGMLSLPPTEKQVRRRKLRNRPEWGEGHAGGHRMQIRGSGASSGSLMPPSTGDADLKDEDEDGEDEEAAGSPGQSSEDASSPLSLGVPGLGASGGGAPVFKLALPHKEEPKGFTQWQEWKLGPVPKPKAAQASIPRRTGVQPEPSRPGAEPIEAWRTPEPQATLPVQLPSTSAPWLNWFVNAASGEDGSGSPEASSSSQPWQQQLQTADAQQLTALLKEVCTTDDARAMQCLTAVRTRLLAPRDKRARAYEGPHVDLAEAEVSKHIVAAMRAYATHEALQFTGCEVLGLLANHYYGLEQTVFEAGAVEACLAACQAYMEERLNAEEVLGAAFQAIHNVCMAEEAGDKEGCLRKKMAVEAGALEAIHNGMGAAREKWVMQAGKLAIGCLCKGQDPHGQVRRKRAHALFKLNR